jgi:hypothetical protein
MLPLIIGGKNMKYKNIGNALKDGADEKGTKNPENLARFGDRSKRTSKTHLARGAFGNPVHTRPIEKVENEEKETEKVANEKVNEEQGTKDN